MLPATFRSTLQKPKQHVENVEPDLERAIYGSWKRGKGLKKDGLMKKVRTLPEYLCIPSAEEEFPIDLFPHCGLRYLPSYLVLQSRRCDIRYAANSICNSSHRISSYWPGIYCG